MSSTRSCLLLLSGFFCDSSVWAVTIETIPIGNPRNAADTRYLEDNHPNGIGSVAYPFRMGKTEVTNEQYVEFLNAAAASDPYELYVTDGGQGMGEVVNGGIVRSGSAGSYSYAVKVPVDSYTYDDKPAWPISWFDAIRFANWLHNGEGGPGTTEDGAYTLSGGTPTPSNWQTITRNPGARWWLPNEDEWYKAAYYDPNTGIYYDYPMGTNSVPNNNLPLNDTGNSGNFDYATGNWNYAMTDAGAYTLSASPYGTFDQGGNVWEWTETPPLGAPMYRVERGGSYDSSVILLHASEWTVDGPSIDPAGFRLATIIPEPSTLLLLALGGLALLLRQLNPAARRG